MAVRSRLRNLLYYLHENCLVMLDFVFQRWSAESQTQVRGSAVRSAREPVSWSIPGALVDGLRKRGNQMQGTRVM